MAVIFFNYRATVSHDSDADIIIEKFKRRKIIAGHSYILDLQSLLDARSSNRLKVLYIYLASLRNWADYKLYNDATIHRGLVQNPQTLNLLTNSELFTIINTRIQLKYEK